MENIDLCNPQVKSRTSPEPLSSYPRIYPNLSTARPLSPHSEYQDYQHHKDQVKRENWMPFCCHFSMSLFFSRVFHQSVIQILTLHQDFAGHKMVMTTKNHLFCKLIFCLDHQDSFGIKKERSVSVEETEYIDKKILMAERFFVNGDNPLLSRWILKIPIYHFWQNSMKCSL